jgi:hypothetical protein
MASPKLMCRLARIQESADGMMISVVRRRLSARARADEDLNNRRCDCGPEAQRQGFRSGKGEA